MPNYHLSEAAKEDLIRIAQYGDNILGLLSLTITATNSNADFQLLQNDHYSSLPLIIFGLDTDVVFVAHIRFITELRVIV